MAKSLRSKVKRRFRKLKRGHLNEIIVKPQTQQLHEKCQKSLLGFDYRQKEHKNAFLHPNDSEAKFPQFKPQPIIDLRSASIPGSGLQWSGACRKIMKDPVFEEEQIDCEVNEEFNKLAMNDPEEVRVDNGMNEEKTTKKKRKRVSKNRKIMVF